MVSQVIVVGILMIVQGVLTILMALGLGGIGFMALVAPTGPKNDDRIVLVLFMIFGVVLLVCGTANIVAGVKALKYRSRALVIVAVFANLVPMLTCYCAPTAIGVLIYGLIVLFQSDVARAFDLGDRGVSPDEIKDQFDGYGRRRRRRRDDDDRYDRDPDEDDERDDDRREKRDSPPRRPETPPDEGFRADDR